MAATDKILGDIVQIGTTDTRNAAVFVFFFLGGKGGVDGWAGYYIENETGSQKQNVYFCHNCNCFVNLTLQFTSYIKIVLCLNRLLIGSILLRFFYSLTHKMP